MVVSPLREVRDYQEYGCSLLFHGQHLACVCVLFMFAGVRVREQGEGKEGYWKWDIHILMRDTPATRHLQVPPMIMSSKVFLFLFLFIFIYSFIFYPLLSEA